MCQTAAQLRRGGALAAGPATGLQTQGIDWRTAQSIAVIFVRDYEGPGLGSFARAVCADLPLVMELSRQNSRFTAIHTYLEQTIKLPATKSSEYAS